MPVDIADRIQAAQPQPQTPQRAPKRPRTNIIDKFTPEGIAAIKDPKQLFDIAAFGYYERQKYVKPEHVKSLSSANWIKDVYRISTGIPEIRSNEDIDNFNKFDEAVYKYIKEVKQGKQLLQSQQRLPRYKQRSPVLPPLPQQSPIPEQFPQILQPLPQPTQTKSEEGPSDTSFGSGLGSGLITQCPNNILADVERLEILIGGKRAGNNSSEIINEASDICKRLFSGGIMDIDVYRSLINEIADDYYSD